SVFFFQAEDGIRDRNVTGVQTCALPISTHSALSGSGWQMLVISATCFQRHQTGQCMLEVHNQAGRSSSQTPSIVSVLRIIVYNRSEERRVGKESICSMEDAR